MKICQVTTGMIPVRPVGEMGWGDPTKTLERRATEEQLMFESTMNNQPIVFKMRAELPDDPELAASWNKYQDDHGRLPGSNDMTLLTAWAFGKKFWFLPQLTGSCVFSNTFRAVVDRMICELGIQGQGEEYFGNEEFSIKSIAPHMISYGFARQIANMRGSDGLYCEPMIKSFTNIGFVTCSTPKLREVMAKAGANDDDDYPEPKSTSLVRRIQNWEFNEVLRPYADFRLMESTVVRSGDDLERASKARKPAMNCSGYAIKVIGKSADGWNIHGRDPSNSWAHNMSWRGHRVDSKGRVYDILANESWVQRGDPNPERYIYYIPREEAHKMVSNSSNVAMTIGDIDFPKSAPKSA